MPTGHPHNPARAAARGRATRAAKRKAQRERERSAVHGQEVDHLLERTWAPIGALGDRPLGRLYTLRDIEISIALDELLDEIEAKRGREKHRGR